MIAYDALVWFMIVYCYLICACCRLLLCVLLYGCLCVRMIVDARVLLFVGVYDCLLWSVVVECRL